MGGLAHILAAPLKSTRAAKARNNPVVAKAKARIRSLQMVITLIPVPSLQWLSSVGTF